PEERVGGVAEDVLGGVAGMCDDGEQSVREAAERPPALILLDLMLPRVSGWEVARRLRQSPRTATVPIVAVSALARPQEREAALHAGCDAYLTKPFTPDALARVVSVTLQNYGVAVRGAPRPGGSLWVRITATRPCCCASCWRVRATTSSRRPPAKPRWPHWSARPTS